MIQFEKRVIVNVDCEIAASEVQELLTEETEFNALDAMLSTIAVAFEANGDICSTTSMTTPLGQNLDVLVIPPMHPSIRNQGETGDYDAECCDESGQVIGPDMKLCQGTKRFGSRDCCAIAVALHRLLVIKEAHAI